MDRWLNSKVTTIENREWLEFGRCTTLRQAAISPNNESKRKFSGLLFLELCQAGIDLSFKNSLNAGDLSIFLSPSEFLSDPKSQRIEPY